MPIISPTAISPHRIGKKFDWSSYWETLISATVENAAPTHVVLTFPSAKTSLGASDFTIAGFTISSAGWTGAVLTLVLSRAVLVFDEDFEIEFEKTGETATVTNNVTDDTNSAAWFDLTDTGEMTIVEVEGKASAIADKLGSAIALTQATPESQMIYTGDLETTANGKYTTGTLNLPQPVAVYLVFRNDLSPTTTHGVFDGESSTNRCALMMRVATSAVNYTVNAGANVDIGLAIQIGVYVVVRILFNNTASYARIGEVISAALSPGTKAAHGFSLNTIVGAASGISGRYREVILRKVVDAEAIDNAIFACLNRKHDFYFKFFKTSYTLTPYTSIDIPIEENENMNTAQNAYSLNLSIGVLSSVLYGLYDGICSSRTLIGTTDLTTPIYSYKFSNRIGKPKILIITTTHGLEHASTWAVFKLLKYIYHDNVQDAKYLDFKDKFDITVIPALNPDGMEEGNRVNSNDVDINRNFPIYYRFGSTDGGVGTPTYGGTAPLSENESQALASIIDNYDIVIDIHSNGGGTEVDPTMFWISTTSKFMEAIFTAQHDALVAFLVDKYPSMEGVTKIGIADSLTAGTIQCYALSRKNTLGVTLEVSSANPYVGVTQYLAEILDMNEYIVFNTVYKIGLEYLANK